MSMLIRANPKEGVPVYMQIIEQIRYFIATGALSPGDKLPTVRELAMELLVNPNTVAKAYTELEREGLVESRQGSGTYVIGKPAKLPVARRNDELAPLADRLLMCAMRHGMELNEVLQMIKAHWEDLCQITGR